MVAFFPVLAAKFITQIALMLDAVALADACIARYYTLYIARVRARQTILLHCDNVNAAE